MELERLRDFSIFVFFLSVGIVFLYYLLDYLKLSGAYGSIWNTILIFSVMVAFIGIIIGGLSFLVLQKIVQMKKAKGVKRQ